MIHASAGEASPHVDAQPAFDVRMIAPGCTPSADRATPAGTAVAFASPAIVPFRALFVRLRALLGGPIAVSP
jgi:hypothetical protein